MSATPASTQRPLAFVFDRHATPTRGILLLRLGACHQYAEGKGWDIAGEWVDDGDNALTDDRRLEFDRMLTALAIAHEGGRDIVCVVFGWDRLSRNPSRREKFARQVGRAGGWIETITGETTKPGDARRRLPTNAPTLKGQAL